MSHFVTTTKATIKNPKLACPFVENFNRLYGLIVIIVSDYNKKIDSHFWQAVFKILDAMLNLSTVDHPQMDGQSEIANSRVLDLLNCYVHDHKEKWE